LGLVGDDNQGMINILESEIIGYFDI
jgi:hypothetical protein